MENTIKVERAIVSLTQDDLAKKIGRGFLFEIK